MNIIGNDFIEKNRNEKSIYDRPSVSVIVPIHNAEKYLRTTINHILNQSLKNIEVILVNDNCTDCSVDICNEYACIDKRVFVFCEQCGGVSASRNFGICHAKGEYIAFVDHDDLIDSMMYEDMYSIAHQADVDIIDCEYKTIYLNGNEVISTHNHPKYIILDREYIVANIIPSLIGVSNDNSKFIFNVVWNKLYKNDIIINSKIRFREDRMKYEDRLFTVEFLHVANSYISINKCYYNYIKRDGSLLSKYNPEEFSVVLANQLRYQELFGNVYDFNCNDVTLYRISSISSVVHTILLHMKMYDSYKQIVKVIKNDHVSDWFNKLQPSSLFYQLMKIFVTKKRYNCAFTLFYIRNLPSLMRNKMKRLL